MTILPRGVGYPTKQVLLDAVTLRFARLTIDFQPADKSVRFRIDETHLPFVVSNAVSPDLELRCRIGEIEPPTGAITFSAGNAWELRRAADGSEDMIIPGASKMVRPVWHVRVDPAYRHGVLTETSVTAGGVVRADGYPLLEYLVARLAGRHGGLLIHAS